MNDPEFQTACCRCCEGTGKGFNHIAYGRYMAAKRKAAGLPLRAIAQASGLSISYIAELEKGQRDWNQSLTDKYLKGLLIRSENE